MNLIDLKEDLSAGIYNKTGDCNKNFKIFTNNYIEDNGIVIDKLSSNIYNTIDETSCKTYCLEQESCK